MQGFYVAGIQANGVPLSVITPNEHGKVYAVLTRDLVYIDASDRSHIAHRGMLTDGLTVPRVLWRIVGPPFRHKYLMSAIIHDHYCYKSLSIEPGEHRNALRSAADRLWLEMCQYQGVGWVQGQALYRAVRLGSFASQFRGRLPDYQHEYNRFYRQHGYKPNVVNTALLQSI